jgi:hypothetical protein
MDHLMQNQVQRIKARHESYLLSFPNVTGVAVGLCQENGTFTQEICIVVYVKKKIDPKKLKPTDIIPPELDGIRVDVQESGEFRPH